MMAIVIFHFYRQIFNSGGRFCFMHRSNNLWVSWFQFYLNFKWANIVSYGTLMLIDNIAVGWFIVSLGESDFQPAFIEVLMINLT